MDGASDVDVDVDVDAVGRAESTEEDGVLVEDLRWEVEYLEVEVGEDSGVKG